MGNWTELSAMLEAGTLTTMPPKQVDPSALPRNFPPVLVPVMQDEIRMLSRGFNPRIHLVRKAQGPELHVLWRKELDFYVEKPDGATMELPIPPFFILDATGDFELLGKVFGAFTANDVEELKTPDWPDSVRVHQWADDLVSRQTPSALSRARAPSRPQAFWPGNGGTAEWPPHSRTFLVNGQSA